jgi:hypothetical protein
MPNAPATSVPISHADAAFDLLSLATIQNCTIGSVLVNAGFVGPGVAVRGDHSNLAPSNTNTWAVIQSRFYHNKHAIYIMGVDSNVGKVWGVDSVQGNQTTVNGFSFLDFSQTGTTFLTCHCSGGFGWIGYPDTASSSTLLGCYIEGGTTSVFGTGVRGISRELNGDMGGQILSYSWNEMLIGGVDGAAFKHQVYFSPSEISGAVPCFMQCSAPGSVGGLVFRMSDLANEATTGYFEWVHYGAFRKHPIMISDTDTGLSGGPGDLWLPQGFWIGEATSSSLADPRAARQVAMDDDPVLANNRRVGDIVLNRTAVPGGFAGQQAVVAGNPGTLLPFGLVEAQDLKSISLAGGLTTMTVGAVDAASARVRFTGTLTANITVSLQTPLVQSGSGPNSRQWIVQNQTTGAFTVTINTNADIGIVLNQTLSQLLWSDGTTMFAGGVAA